jgi:NitT/TauT family transport system ATP-binding protein
LIQNLSGASLDTSSVPSAPSAPSFECHALQVTLYGAAGAAIILEDVNLTVTSGEFVSVLGTSGSGKTTLLRVLGGLQEKSSGRVLCGGRPVSGPPRSVVTVFQDYSRSLLQWRTVRRNVALGIEGRLSKAECTDRVDEALEIVGLAAHANEYPWRLSGGMQQRVQIARAMAMRPSVLLMDEPFGALDAMTKANLQDELQQLHAVTGTTIIFVTHDVDEAIYLSDRVVVLQGTPAKISLDIGNGLPRPRDQVSTRETTEYLAGRHQVYEALGHRTRRA